MYTHKAKYSSKNNSFIFKFTIFYDISAGADVFQNILLKTFLTMLTALTLDHYYSKTSISITAIFVKVFDLIPTYFKGIEYKNRVLFQWNMTTLNSIIEMNERKSIEEYLQFFIKDLRYL